MTSKLLTIFILLLGIFPFFFRLGDNYLTNFDEAFYGVIAKEVAQNNSWFQFTFAHELFFAVSPLYIWLTAAWFRFFGISEFGVRFFAAFSSLLTVLSGFIFFLKKKYLLSGFIYALVLLSTVKFLFLSRTGNLDATLTLFTTLSFLFFLEAWRKPWYILYGGFFSGLAFLTKSLFGIIPLMVYFLYALFAKRRLNKRLLFLGLGVFLAVVLPWNSIEIYHFGSQFVQGFYGGYMSTKIGSVPFSSRLWWGSGLWQGMKLWLPISLVAFIYLFKKEKNKMLLKFCLLTIILYCLVLSLIQYHNDWYLMPLYPLLAMIIGEAIFHLESDLKVFKGLTLIFTVTIALFHLIHYQTQYFIPQTTDAQVMMVKEANRRSTPGKPILLDDFYYPVAIFYSNLPIVRLRANRDPQAALFPPNLNTHLSQGSLLLTNTTTVETVKAVSEYPLVLEKAHGELLLFRPELKLMIK